MLEAQLDLHTNKLKSMDRYWYIESDFIAHVTGVGGQKCLEQMLLDHLPTPTKHVGLDVAVQQAHAVLRCDLFKYASTDAQGTLKSGCELLFQMQNGLPLILPADPNKFMLSVWAALPNFVRCDADGAASKNGSGVGSQELPSQKLVGLDALLKLFDKTKARTAADLSLKDLEPFVVHGHLLSEAQRGEVQKLTEVVLAKTEGKKGASKSSSSKRAKGTDSASKQKGPDALKAQAYGRVDALFE